MYAERAKTVQARLRKYGVPMAVQIQYTENGTMELAVQPSTIAIICLMEMLASDIEAADPI